MQTISPIFRLFFWLTFVSAAAAQTGGSWQSLAPMPTGRQELATAALNGKIYVIGGYDGVPRSTNIVEVYDPGTNTWASAHPIPMFNNHNSAAVAAGKLYSFGGLSPQTFVYNEASDSWSAVASMNFLHGATPAVGVLNDKIYVVGGAGAMKKLEVYDPVANTWKKLKSMKTGRNHAGGAFIDGKFYVVGGRGPTGAESAHEVYDPQTNKWTRRARLPTGRSGIAVAAVNGELFVFGGETPMAVHGEVEAYNPMTNTWRSLPNMPIPRHGIWASVIGNKVFLPGGATEPAFAATNVNEVFTVDGGTEITSTEQIGSNVVVKFRTRINHTYLVKRTNDPLSGNWIAVSNLVVGTGGIVMVLDVNAATLPKRFYRVQEL
jgi:N-acetylneuraminic acid mutarotase